MHARGTGRLEEASEQFFNVGWRVPVSCALAGLFRHVLGSYGMLGKAPWERKLLGHARRLKPFQNAK